MTPNRQTLEYFSGCLLGGAVGDALGAPVEFMTLSEILSRFGTNGIRNYASAYGKKGSVTDDTQMTLFTAEGLILSNVRGAEEKADILSFVYQAYLRWLSTQQSETSRNQLLNCHGTCGMIDGLLIGHPALYFRRAPGNSCLSALECGRMGTIGNPVNNSKGCGGVMRIAPAGLFLPPEMVFDIACDIAAVTHGHPTGYLASGCLAQIINAIIYGADLPDAIEKGMKVLETKPCCEECLKAVQVALDAWEKQPVSFETVEKLGKGWIAEESLGIGIYCALAAENDFEKGIWLAVNHGGDSDSTGSIAGNILGAILGRRAIPENFLKDLELIDVIEEISQDMFERIYRFPEK